MPDYQCLWSNGCRPIGGFLVSWPQIAIEPLAFFITVFDYVCFTVIFADEVKDPYADRIYTVDTRYFDLAYLEYLLISKLKSGPCLNMKI